MNHEFIQLYKQMNCLCKNNKWGDPFSYARGKEIYASLALGHTISDTLAGADAYTKDGEPCEYKSTTNDKVRGLYSGISVFNTWSEQKMYLEQDKIGKYKHFYNRFDEFELIESWTIPTDKVLDILLPKIQEKYYDADNLLKPNKNKDPRISVFITYNEIMNFGSQII